MVPTITYIIKRTDGTVAITRLIEVNGVFSNIEDIIEQTFEPGTVESFREMAIDEQLPDRHWRDQWWMHADKVEVNMPAARVKVMEKVRRKRNKTLVMLDKEIVIALGKGQSGALPAIEAKKQILRDLPVTFKPTLEAVTDPVVLKTTWPQELV